MFTGTFSYGQRKHCEAAVTERGGIADSLTQKTNVLVIGLYATEHGGTHRSVTRSYEQPSGERNAFPSPLSRRSIRPNT
jgi:hypothetical protein